MKSLFGARPTRPDNLLDLHPGLLGENPGLAQLVKDDELIDAEIDTIINKIRSKKSDPGLDEERETQLKQSLHTLHDIQNQQFKALEFTRRAHAETSAHLKRILLPKEDDATDFSVVGNKLADFNFNFLARGRDGGIYPNLIFSPLEL
jgi:hypothetical protein